jgi:hypothetical protein
MSFLSLAAGDPAARNLLQKAIRARYGMRPLPVESVRLSMTARAKGPLGLPATAHITLSFIAPTHWRWDRSVKFLSFPLSQFTARFDGTTYYEQNGKNVMQSNDAPAVEGMRCRLWSEVAALLTPLTVRGVILKTVDEHTFQATLESAPTNAAIIHLNDDDTLESIQADCYRNADQFKAPLTIRPQGGLQTLDGFTVPNQIAYQWGTEQPEIYTIVKAEANPQIPADEFTLK